jgi:hypothetical protein
MLGKYTGQGYSLYECALMRCRAVSVELVSGGDVELIREPLGLKPLPAAQKSEQEQEEWFSEIDAR